MIPLVFMHVFSFLSLSRSLSLWRLLSLQSCGDLLFAISFSLSEFMFCLSYRGSAHESVLWRACYLCRYSASRWQHSSIYSSYSFHSSIYSSCFHASVLSLSLSLFLAYTLFVFMYLYSLSFSHKLQLFSCICTLSLSLSLHIAWR